MNKKRLNQDFVLLKYGNFGNATWTFNSLGTPIFIKIIIAFLLDTEKFSLAHCNLLIPIPSNIYGKTAKGKFHFYRYVYVDENLKIRKKGDRWRNIKRGYAHNLYQMDKIPSKAGWQWICYMNPVCGADDNILTLVASVQTFLNNDA